MIFTILFFGLIIRIVAAYFFGDVKIDNEWDILLNNLYEHGTYSYRSFDGQLIPSVYMPPLYVFFMLNQDH